VEAAAFRMWELPEGSGIAAGQRALNTPLSVGCSRKGGHCVHETPPGDALGSVEHLFLSLSPLQWRWSTRSDPRSRWTERFLDALKRALVLGRLRARGWRWATLVVEPG
jgi:hypothetical protein